MAFMVRSNSFKDGDYLASDHILSADYGFGCEGGNKSPHLAWSGVPAGSKSFAITCFDPDAPTANATDDGGDTMVAAIDATDAIDMTDAPDGASDSAHSDAAMDQVADASDDSTGPGDAPGEVADTEPDAPDQSVPPIDGGTDARADGASAVCPRGDGLYCGGNGVSGNANTLYWPISICSPNIAVMSAEGRVVTTRRCDLIWPGLCQSATDIEDAQVTSRSKLFAEGGIQTRPFSSSSA